MLLLCLLFLSLLLLLLGAFALCVVNCLLVALHVLPLSLAVTPPALPCFHQRNPHKLQKYNNDSDNTNNETNTKNTININNNATLCTKMKNATFEITNASTMDISKTSTTRQHTNTHLFGWMCCVGQTPTHILVWFWYAHWHATHNHVTSRQHGQLFYKQ